MVQQERTYSNRRAITLQWTARLGAITAEALADLQDVTLASARGQLVAAERRRLMLRHRPLASHPSLFTLSPAGLRCSAERGLDPCRVSAANARHLGTCAWVAARLARLFPDQHVVGERELRRDERQSGQPLASAILGAGLDGRPLLHRPDLALWPQAGTAEDAAPAGLRRSRLPVAVEVELTVKAPRRLGAICRGWARCRCVAGVLYVATPEAERALRRAIDDVRAADRVVVVSLAALS